ncbi:MAG: hypothetical protein V3W44_10225 [Dehalococcoidales bacterium]
MTVARITQQTFETLNQADDPAARISQAPIEVLNQADTPSARISQLCVEVLSQSNNPPLRVTQQYMDIMRQIAPGNRAARISQLYTDTIRTQEPTSAFVSQVYTDTIRQNVQTAQPGLKSWMVFDRDGFFDVTVISGTPTTAASELIVRNGANLIAMGKEILHFQNAEDLGDNVFRLSNLLRGRLGTEQQMNSHASNELVFFLTTSTTRRIQEEFADLNNVRFWKIVGIGQLVESRAAISAVNTGESLKPWAPVRIAGTRDGSLNLTITWVRRSRIGHQRLLVAAPPIGEDTEEYQVEIIQANGTVVRTFSPDEETQLYTAAQQITDFGSEQALILVRVGQVSVAYGVGYVNSELI